MRALHTAAPAIEALSPRRRELLQLLAKGLTNDEIARAMEISPGTVRTHVTAVLGQLEVANRTEAAAAYVAWEAGAARVEVVMQRPAVAVLPVVALEDDPRTRTVAAGLTEDLATLFSRWCWFPVIATSSTAGARGLGSGKELARQLGARFLVDGSLRLVGSQCRLVVHIDDGESGHRLWSGTHDFLSQQLFEVQDQVCQAVVATTYPLLVDRILGRPQARPAGSLPAWALAQDGMALQSAREPDSNAAALDLFQQALRLEPDLVLAHYGTGLASYDAVLNQWGPKEAALGRLVEAAERCLRYAPHSAEGHYLLGRHLQSRSDWEGAVGPLAAAVGHNPSFALAHASLAQSLQVVGSSDEGLVRMRHAVRLGPRSFVAGLATLHFMRQEYAEALQTAERAVLTNPRYTWARALAASAAWWLGDVPRGQAHLQALRERYPQFRPEGFLSTFGAGVDAVERLAQALASLSRR